MAEEAVSVCLVPTSVAPHLVAPPSVADPKQAIALALCLRFFHYAAMSLYRALGVALVFAEPEHHGPALRSRHGSVWGGLSPLDDICPLQAVEHCAWHCAWQAGRADQRVGGGAHHGSGTRWGGEAGNNGNFEAGT